MRSFLVSPLSTSLQSLFSSRLSILQCRRRQGCEVVPSQMGHTAKEWELKVGCNFGCCPEELVEFSNEWKAHSLRGQQAAQKGFPPAFRLFNLF
ncbi:hypothetical protein BT69DRAFT_829333 [Atractiella rhizophila]|nr:hypothetical protein BT69DRAFT_829333 [Atractiella rhizophila]